MNKNLNPFPSYLACMNIIKAAQMFFCGGNRGQMRLVFLCKDKASQNGASAAQRGSNSSRWSGSRSRYPGSGTSGPRNSLQRSTLTHRQWEKACVKLGEKVGYVW